MKQVRQAEWSRITGGPATRPLDAALQFIRAHAPALLPVYVLAMLPMAVAMMLFIDTISAEHRTGLFLPCLLLVASLFWRWVGLTFLQRMVVARIAGRHTPLPLGRWPAILLGRLLCNVALTWGSVMVIPAYWGLFTGSFLAPAVLEDDGPIYHPVRTIFSWINRSVGRLSLIATILALLMLLSLLAVAGLHGILLSIVLPSMLNIDPSELSITFSSIAWLLTIGFGLFALFDFHWAVASVFVFHDLRSRRLGNDLVGRLAALRAGGVA